MVFRDQRVQVDHFEAQLFGSLRRPKPRRARRALLLAGRLLLHAVLEQFALGRALSRSSGGPDVDPDRPKR
ncbi:MAG: hypothetical protein HS111_36205 [Kofleriaceae bacterium]|nr:hypothetical protein [Kofleriaceae bacterium]